MNALKDEPSPDERSAYMHMPPRATLMYHRV
jgi:hypothetical protein